VFEDAARAHGWAQRHPYRATKMAGRVVVW
jgi:hypothetical protein